MKVATFTMTPAAVLACGSCGARQKESNRQRH
jgi:hypothetical protein